MKGDILVRYDRSVVKRPHRRRDDRSAVVGVLSETNEFIKIVVLHHAVSRLIGVECTLNRVDWVPAPPRIAKKYRIIFDVKYR